MTTLVISTIRTEPEGMAIIYTRSPTERAFVLTQAPFGAGGCGIQFALLAGWGQEGVRNGKFQIS